MIEVAAALLIQGDKFLALQRGSTSDLAGYWEIPGGKCEPDESLEVCLHRELAEELGIDIGPGRYFTQNVHRYADKTVRLTAFIVRDWRGEIVLHVHSDMVWIDIVDHTKLTWAPADIPILSKLEQLSQY